MFGYMNGTTVAPSEFIEVQKADKSSTEQVANPLYDLWVYQDQQVLAYVMGSLSTGASNPTPRPALQYKEGRDDGLGLLHKDEGDR